jgi:protocatechuate 3,4-dioxygenase, alpha subunit
VRRRSSWTENREPDTTFEDAPFEDATFKRASLSDWTPSQTAGPFVSICCDWMTGVPVADTLISRAHDAAGADSGCLTLTGIVLDGAAEPVTDAMLEFWQADPDGHFPPDSPPAWRGFARALTDSDGRYRLVTVKPGSVPSSNGAPQAPHLDVSIFARGLMQRLVTRIYLSDDADALACDPLLESIPSHDRARLVAMPGDGPGEFVFDIRLQGDQETVFFEPC